MQDFRSAYEMLNDKQRQAVDTLDGPVLVVAGPGSGKTQLLTLRIANILDQTDVSPDQILCLTFTEAAAANMRSRLRRIIGSDAYQVGIHTFHSFGSEIIRSYPEIMPEFQDSNPIDPIRADELIRDIISNLRYDNPLRSQSADGFVFKKSILSNISHLKKAGLSPQDFLRILVANEHDLELLSPIIEQADTISLKKKTGYLEWQDIVSRVAELKGQPGHSYFSSLIDFVLRSLEDTVTEALTLEKGTPLSKWKTAHLDRPTKGASKQLKDGLRLETMKAFAEVYQQYQDRLTADGYIDFDDMILGALSSLRENAYLQAKLSDQYQYLLIDEFQDTNDAQMQMVYLLTEGKSQPNILAVGDDDQGIYRFQGAEISNIMAFKDHFPGTKIITLTKNYRSRQEILDVARKVITQGQDRLENKIEEVEKQLEAAGTIEDGDLAYHRFDTAEHEYSWITTRIQELLSEGHMPSEIAIIGRNHRYLQEIVPYLVSTDIPVSYSKKHDLLMEPHIDQLVTMARYVDSLSQVDGIPRDDLLPEILSYPFWNISRIDAWQFWKSRRRSGKSWIELLSESQISELREVGEMFQSLAMEARNRPMERIFFSLMGDDHGKIDTLSTGYKKYYLDLDRLHSSEAEYVSFISTIRSFLETIKEYEAHRMLKLSDAIRVIDAYQASGGMLAESAFRTAKEAVSCVTAHGSKGLEFETVFVVNVSEPGWAGKGKSSNLKLPMNLPLEPQQDSIEDFLRLFFVSITRAKRNLIMTGHEVNAKGKDIQKLSFVDFVQEGDRPHQELRDVIDTSWDIFVTDGFSQEEARFLESTLIDYRMTPSHLNAFVDVRYKGPQYVLDHYILRFPGITTPQAAYGNALHKTLQTISISVKAGKGIPSLDTLLTTFERRLTKDRLSQDDHLDMMEKIRDILPLYLDAKKGDYEIVHHSEYSVSELNLIIEEVPIKGTIDRVELRPEINQISLVDFKTAKPIDTWNRSTYADKLASYRRQLIMYGLMIDRAGVFGTNQEIVGRIDFLQPDANNEFVSLELPMNRDEMDEVVRLMEIVYHKITTLDFPDITPYQAMKNGQEAFIQDLLEGRV